MISVLKASAGSGKTFRLAKTYIRLLLGSDDPAAYRHILAVTFTNKATEQMKSRILKELDVLARDPASSPYYAEFARDFGGGEVLRRRASGLLRRILHDYSAFSISTIDKFFQMALKAFAREIGQFASYQVELDKKSLIHESVDRILDGLDEARPRMVDWLTDNMMDQLSGGRRPSLEERLYAMAERLKSEEHREAVERAGLDEERLYDPETLRSVRKACRRCQDDFRAAVAAAAHRVADVLQEAAVLPEESNRKFLAQVFRYLCPEDPVLPPTDFFFRTAADPEQWFAKNKAARLLPQVRGRLDPVLEDFCALFGRPFVVYQTAGVLLGELYDLGIASELQKTFSALLKEKNVLSIDDSNHTLRAIIGGSDAPFVYEKLGVRFEHFLLDEFQDTSLIQWENFRPLLAESEAGGHESLVVGDIKQSIYRWRGSDWNLLASWVRQAFPDAVEPPPLQDNWRSRGEIVRLVSSFFPYAAGALDAQLGGGNRLSDIYADVRQTIRIPGSGRVECTFTPGDQMEEVLEAIRQIRASGGRYGQTAILVRENSSGSALASFLVSRDVPVISDEALRVKASVTVRRLVSLLTHAENPSDSVGSYLAQSLSVEVPRAWRSLVDLCEDLLRSLRGYDPEAYDGEVLYIQSFMDDLTEWTSRNGNHLGAFLRHWADADPTIASPDLADAVRILTIHKAKGLEFPYVIFPYAERVRLFRDETHWSRPQLDGTPLSPVADGVYPVLLSGKSMDTLFAADYQRERFLQHVDNLNTFYVALTRAGVYLHVVAALPKLSSAPSKDFSQLLFAFLDHPAEDLEDRYLKTEREDGAVVFATGRLPEAEPPKADDRALRPSGYPSFPLNPAPGQEDVDVRERGRLKFSADALDYFAPDGQTGADASVRLKGILLHGILSSVRSEDDLDRAVDQAALRGELTGGGVQACRDYLRAKLAFVRDRGWFAPDAPLVRCERAVVDADGEVYRPDRVVRTPGGLVVIDYKFGRRERAAYRRQVGEYLRLYRAMGYPSVTGYLWYVEEDRVEEVS